MQKRDDKEPIPGESKLTKTTNNRHMGGVHMSVLFHQQHL